MCLWRVAKGRGLVQSMHGRCGIAWQADSECAAVQREQNLATDGEAAEHAAGSVRSSDAETAENVVSDGGGSGGSEDEAEPAATADGGQEVVAGGGEDVDDDDDVAVFDPVGAATSAAAHVGQRPAGRLAVRKVRPRIKYRLALWSCWGMSAAGAGRSSMPFRLACPQCVRRCRRTAPEQQVRGEGLRRRGRKAAADAPRAHAGAD